MTRASRRFDNKFERFTVPLIAAFSIPLFTLVAQGQQLLTKVSLQQSRSVQSPGSRRIQAIRVSDTIKIDGLLDEAAWSVAQPATDFRHERRFSVFFPEKRDFFITMHCELDNTSQMRRLQFVFAPGKLTVLKRRTLALSGKPQRLDKTVTYREA